MLSPGYESDHPHESRLARAGRRSTGWTYDKEPGPGPEAQQACDKVSAALAGAGMRILPHPHMMWGVPAS